MESAYFDRITDKNQAVLLIDSIGENIILPLANLPDKSIPGHWFLISIKDHEVTSIQFDENKTNLMKNDIQNRLQRLQSRKKSRFKKQK